MANSWRMTGKKDEIDMKELGNQRFQAGDYLEAIKLYTKGLCADPPPSDAQAAVLYQNRAAAFEKRGATAQVIEDCSKALDKSPRYTKAYGRRGRANHRLGEHQKAAFDFTAASMLSQHDDEWSEYLDDAVDKLGKQKGKEAMMQHIRGEKLVPLSTAAVDEYLYEFCEDPTLTLINPTDDQKKDHQNAGLSEVCVLLEKKRYKEAMEVCGKVKGEGEAMARLLHATFAYICFNFRLVREDLRALFHLLESMTDKEMAKKMKVNAYIKLAQVHIQEGNQDGGLKYLQRAEALDPNNVDVFYQKGQSIFLHNLEDAKVFFERCVQLRPDWTLPKVQVYGVDYRLAQKKGNSAKAQIAIGRLEQLQHKFPCLLGYPMLLSIYMTTGDFAKLNKLLEKTLELFPTSPYAYGSKGMLKMKMGQGNEMEALSLIKKGLEVDPHSGLGYFDLGSFEMTRGNLRKALEYAERGLEVARTEETLAMLFSLQGRLVAEMKVASELF